MAVPATSLPANVPAVLPSATVAAPPTLGEPTSEELVLLHVIGLMRRELRSGTLSPVDRAFVKGARAIFDHLSEECERMLSRTVEDLVKVPRHAPKRLAAGSASETPRPSRTRASGTGTSRSRAMAGTRKTSRVKAKKAPATG